MTLMKSNTTRRSHPITMSRLRKPTSKSMTTVFLPRSARPAPSAAVEVVLPTPPLPEVMTMILATLRCLLSAGGHLFQRLHAERAAVEECLNASAAQRRIDGIAELVETRDRNQLRFEPLAKNARGAVPMDAGERPAAQCAVNMDVAVCDELGAGAH